MNAHASAHATSTPENYQLPPALAPLTAECRWVVWRLEKSDRGKLTKVPYRADAPAYHASSTDPSYMVDIRCSCCGLRGWARPWHRFCAP